MISLIQKIKIVFGGNNTLLFLFTGKITERDIQRVANRMLRSKLSLAAYGTLASLPSKEDMETALLSRDGSMPRKKTFSLFGRR